MLNDNDIEVTTQFPQSSGQNINSAYGLAQFDKFQTLKANKEAERDTAILQTASNTKTQVEMLQKQLKETYKQNETLQKNYETLNNLYKEVAQEIIENKAELEKTKKREKLAHKINFASLIVAILAPIISIIVSILISIYT